MTPERLKSKLEGQSSVARKVFEVVPIQEAWPASQIYKTLNEITRSTMDSHVFRGCLNTLKNSGLIRETAPETYRRIEVRPKKEVEMQEQKTMIKKNNQAEQFIKSIDDCRKRDPIDALIDLSAKVRTLADELDAAVIVVGESMHKHSSDLEKLSQLQSILKSLS